MAEEPEKTEDKQGEDTQQQTGEQQTVPYDRFSEVNQQLSDLKSRNELLEEQILLYQNNQAQSPPQTEQKQESPLDGISDDDIIEGKQLKTILNTAQGNINNQIAELRMHVRYPDLQTTLSEKLPAIVKQNPALAEALKSPYGLAVALYELCKKEGGGDKKLQAAAKQAADAAQKSVDAANRPDSASQVKGKATTGTSWITETSDEEFEAEMAKRGI